MAVTFIPGAAVCSASREHWIFGTEIVRSISGILQFYASEKRENPITDVYYAGCPAGDFEVSVEGIENMNLKTAPMAVSQKISVPPGQTAADWIPCIGAMMRNGRAEKGLTFTVPTKSFLKKGRSSRESENICCFRQRCSCFA